MLDPVQNDLDAILLCWLIVEQAMNFPTCHNAIRSGKFPLLNMEDSNVPDSRLRNSSAELGQWWTMGRQCFWTITVHHFHRYNGHSCHYQNDTLFHIVLIEIAFLHFGSKNETQSRFE